MTGTAGTRQDFAVVTGGRQLHGRVRVPGTKHGTVLAFAAAVTAGATLTLHDVPSLTDRRVLSEVVRGLGGEVTENGTSVVVTGSITGDEIPRELSKLVHGSLYLLPAVLANRGSVVFHGAGGDDLGRFEHGVARPVQHMLDVMSEFGATWRWDDHGTLRVSADGLKPARIDLLRWSTDPVLPEGPMVSGASKTALLMAAATKGTSLILHPHAREAQHELISVLRGLGVGIEQRDACWIVTGGTFHPASTHRLMPCPVEFATWQALAAVTRSTLTAECGSTALLLSAVHREVDFLAGLGIEPVFTDTEVHLGPASRAYQGTRLVAESSGISTDITPLLALLLNGATGPSVVEDRIWGNRFGYAAQLAKLGANMTASDGRLDIVPSRLRATDVPLTPSDTRSAAVCLIAALSVPGRTVVHGLDHLDRGYGNLASRLMALGADVAFPAG